MKKNQGILTTPPFGHPFNKLKGNLATASRLSLVTLSAFCLLLSAFCLLPSTVQAQCAIPKKSAELSVNNIRALFNTNGSHFWGENAGFEVPKGSGKISIFTASLWLGGMDEQNNLHVAAMRYGQKGNDYWAGPFSNNSGSTATYYDKFWRITREEVENHRLHFADEGYVAPEAITNWPAHGRAEFGETEKLAPYKNVSGNSSYTPSEGDYPLIRGDEAIFWISNDICTAHSESEGEPVGVELLCMAYAYNSTDEALKNTIFISYVIRNQSGKLYKDFYVGFFADFDIGYAKDDYVGCDPSLNLAYGYNGKETDGNGQPEAYGANPPAQGAMFLNQSMSAFMYLNNNNTPTGDPLIAPEYYNSLQAKWKDGTPLTMWNNGYDPSSTDYTKYAFSGDPETKTGWTELTPSGEGSVPNVPGDRRGMLSAGPFILDAGKSICVDMALPFAQGENYLASVTMLKQRAQAIQEFYNNQNYDNYCAENIGIKENKPVHNQVHIYPNPSNGQFMINCDKVMENIELYDVLGKKVFTVVPKKESAQLNTGLPQGLYMYRIVLHDNSILSGKILVH
jgi:hypothetical protein